MGRRSLEYKKQQGFTLIELMFGVAIIGILSAVAIPQYQNYMAQARLAKVNIAVEPIKTAMVMFAQENNGFSNLPANGWTSLGISDAGPSSTAEVKQIDVGVDGDGNGTITATVWGVGSDWNNGTVQYSTSANSSTALIWNVSCNFASSSAAAQAISHKIFSC